MYFMYLFFLNGLLLLEILLHPKPTHVYSISVETQRGCTLVVKLVGNDENQNHNNSIHFHVACFVAITHTERNIAISSQSVYN